MPDSSLNNLLNFWILGWEFDIPPEHLSAVSQPLPEHNMLNKQPLMSTNQALPYFFGINFISTIKQDFYWVVLVYNFFHKRNGFCIVNTCGRVRKHENNITVKFILNDGNNNWNKCNLSSSLKQQAESWAVLKQTNCKSKGSNLRPEQKKGRTFQSKILPTQRREILKGAGVTPMEEFHRCGAVGAAASLRKGEKLGGSSGMDTWLS